MVKFDVSKNGRTYGLADLSCKGFSVTTSEDITNLSRSIGGECKLEPLGGTKYYFEFVMPFHTDGEASIRLKNILAKAGFELPKV